MSVKVYIVMIGEQGEYSSIDGVYREHEDAVKAAMNVQYNYDGVWKFTDTDFWFNGSVFVKIVQEELK